MNMLKKTICFLMAAGGLFCLPEISCAQVSIDAPKGVQKIGEGSKEQHIVFQDTIKGISESQFATFVGNGIEGAKKGLTFGKNLVKNVKKFKKDIENSKGLAAMKLSKQIAVETTKLENIQKEKKQAQADLKADAEAEKIVIEEKISIVQNNFKTSTMADTKATNGGEGVDPKEQAEQEIERFQKEKEAIDKNLDEKLIQIEKEYDIKLYEQGKKVVELTKELKKLLGKSKDEEEDKEEKDPLEAVKDTMDELSFRETDIVTVEKRIEKEKKRSSAIVSTTIKTTSASAERIAKTNEEKEDNDSNTNISSTLNGKSESVQLAVTSTAAQAEALYTYLALELKALQEETAQIISSSDYKFSEEPKAIDVCNYKRKNKKKSLKDIIDEGKKAVEKGKGIANQTKDQVDDFDFMN